MIAEKINRGIFVPRRILLFVLLFLAPCVKAQSIKEAWKPLLQQRELAVYFSGLFESLGIRVEGSAEEITVLHHGDHFELHDGIAAEGVDYIVELEPGNIKNMSQHGADGAIDPYESYRIMSVLFTPFAKAALENPMMNKSFPMKLAGIEDHAHVYLESPTTDEFVAHTLIFFNKKWMVIEGLHGEAKRTFRMSPDQTLTYQREVFKAQKENTRRAWRKFMKFYLDWRDEVSKEEGKE